MNTTAQTLSLVSSKGGVGKSTFAINTACALADMGLKVLCIDLDSQQSLTKFFAYPNGISAGLLELVADQDVTNSITQTHISNVSIVVNNDDKELLNEWMQDHFAGSFALKNNLNAIKSLFDIIIIDTQGKDGRGQMQEMALIAADTVIVPTTPDVMSSQELPRSIEIYTHVMSGLADMGLGSDQPPALRVLINREDHTTETRNVTAAIRQQFGAMAKHISVLKTTIPQRVVWRHCISRQEPAHRIEKNRNDERNAIVVMENLIHELLPYYADLTILQPLFYTYDLKQFGFSELDKETSEVSEQFSKLSRLLRDYVTAHLSASKLNGGAMFDHDLQLQQYILNTFKTVAEQRDFKFLSAYGIDQETALHMRELDNHCIQTLAKSRPFTITVSNAAFARKIEDAIDLSKEQRLVREAIILGASRESLAELAYVTDNTFKKISLEVGKLPQTRGRPKSISLEKIDQLAVMHANIIKLHLRMGTTIVTRLA